MLNLIEHPTATLQADLIAWVFIARLVERGVIVSVIVLTAVVLMLLLRRKIQDINLDFGTEQGTLKTSLSLSMPIFLLLMLVAFAYVAFAHPVTLTVTQVPPAAAEQGNSMTQAPPAAAERGNGFKFELVGVGPNTDQKTQRVLAINTVLKVRAALSEGVNPEGLQQAAERLSLAIGILEGYRFELMESLFTPEIRAECGQWKRRPGASEIPEKCRDFVNTETESFK